MPRAKRPQVYRGARREPRRAPYATSAAGEASAQVATAAGGGARSTKNESTSRRRRRSAHSCRIRVARAWSASGVTRPSHIYTITPQRRSARPASARTTNNVNDALVGGFQHGEARARGRVGGIVGLGSLVTGGDALVEGVGPNGGTEDGGCWRRVR